MCVSEKKIGFAFTPNWMMLSIVIMADQGPGCTRTNFVCLKYFQFLARK